MWAAARLAAGFLLVAGTAANEANVHPEVALSEPKVSHAPSGAAPGGFWRTLLLAAERGEGLEGSHALLSTRSERGNKVVWPDGMHKGPEEGADNEAMSDFIRRCVVVTTVSHARLLPTKAVDKICRSTDQVVACRLALAGRLKDLHDQGRSMKPFCREAYDWFQKQYGDECPKQCRKLQCRSTCSWLEAKQDLDKEAARINEEMSHVRGKVLQDLEAAENAKQEAKKVLKKENRTMGFAKVHLERATKALREKESEYKWQKKRTDKATKRLKDLEEKEDKLTAEISADSRVLSERKFAMDKLELTTNLLKKRAEELRTRIPALEKKVKEGTEELKAQEEEIIGFEKMLNVLSRKIAVVDKTLKNLMPEVLAQKEVADTAQLALKTAIENGEGRDSLMVLHDYMKQQEAKYFDMVEDAKALDNSKRKLEQKFGNLSSELESLARDVEEKIKILKEATDKLNSFKAEVMEKEDEYKDSKKTLDAERPKVQKLQTDLYIKEAELEKAKKTIGFEKSTHEEEVAKLDAATTDREKAKELWKSKQDGLKEAMTKLKEFEAAVKKTTAAAKAKQREFDKSSGGLRKLQKEHKARKRDLNKRMPKIVSQHRLDKA